MNLHIHKRILFTIICIFIFIFLSSNLEVYAGDVLSDVFSAMTYTVNQSNISYTSSAGYTVNATIMVPDSNTIKNMPLVVMCHGYTGNRNGDDNHFISLGTSLAEKGIAAITIDFPGPGRPADDSQYTLTNMYKDIDSAIDYMISNYSIGTDHIGLVGHSMGGRVVSLYTQNGSHNVQAIALWAPANGDGENGLEFLNAPNASFNFNNSQEFIDEMNSSHPNSALRSYSGAIYLAIDGVDASGNGLISANTMTETANAVLSVGGTVETDLYADTNHNFNDSVGNGGRVVSETFNFFIEEFCGISLDDAVSEIERYTIEDIIFNRIPILDINFFTDTAAGQTVSSGSVIYYIRNSVATWYVAFRNLVIVILVIIVIYIGIRMAMSTIPQTKASYKTMMIGLLQALAIIFVAHLIMIFIINLNNGLVDIFERALDNRMVEIGWTEDGEIEGSIYETIRTRAYSTLLSVSLPASIMYIVLLMIKLRFLWVYIKRMITIMILVIIAPFIAAKYAIESASGRKGKAFSSWLFDFTFNVLIQSVHAVVYTALISMAMSLAFDSIVGYILALIILNFVLSADEFFRDIFEFNRRSSISKDTAKQEGYKEVMENFSSAVFAVQAVKGAWGFAKGGISAIGGAGKAVYNEIKANYPEVDDKVNEVLDSIDKKIEETVVSLQAEDNSIDPLEVKKNLANIILYQAKIRRLSRQKGMVGVKARQLRNSINSHLKKRYSANFKFVKNTITGIGSVILAVPLAVINTTAGAALLTKGVVTLKKQKGKKYYKYNKEGKVVKQSQAEFKAGKYTKKRDKLFASADLVDSIDKQEKEISEEFINLRDDPDITQEQIDTFKDIQNQLLVNANEENIEKIIQDFLDSNKIKTIDKSTINDIIEEVSRKLGRNITGDEDTRQIIESKAQVKAVILKDKERQDNQTKNTENNKFSKEDVTKIMQESISETRIEKKFVGVSKGLFKLDSTVKKYEKKAKTKYRDTNRFLERL